MSLTLKPYAEYTKTFLPWVSEMPSHWVLIPNRGLLRKRKVLLGERHHEYQLLSLTKQGVIIRDISKAKGKFSSDMGTSQEVRQGDLVFCLFDIPETPRTVGLSPHNGMITGAYTVFEPTGRGLSEYVECFYKVMDDRKLLSPLYSGLRNTIQVGAFLSTKTPLPPVAEQQAIVTFTKWASRRIDKLIRAKRQVIVLLNEQKQAIIQRAVARGLDPNVRLKPSGIEWLPLIPDHWTTIRLGSLSTLLQTGPFGSQLHSHEYVPNGIPVINPSHMKAGKIEADSNCAVTSSKAADLSRHCMETGDIVFARRGVLGRCALVSDNEVGWICGTGSLRMKVRQELVSPEYLVQLILSAGAGEWLSLRSVGSTMENLNTAILSQLPLPLPPQGEQVTILEHLVQQRTHIDGSTNLIAREIDALREYRTRLIADVVTGKLDVRGIELPELDEVAEISDVVGEELQDSEELEAFEENVDAD